MRSNRMMNFSFCCGISSANRETRCYAGDGVISIFIKHGYRGGRHQTSDQRSDLRAESDLDCQTSGIVFWLTVITTTRAMTIADYH